MQQGAMLGHQGSSSFQSHRCLLLIQHVWLSSSWRLYEVCSMQACRVIPGVLLSLSINASLHQVLMDKYIPPRRAGKEITIQQLQKKTIHHSCAWLGLKPFQSLRRPRCVVMAWHTWNAENPSIRQTKAVLDTTCE